MTMLIGYAITAAMISAMAMLAISALMERKEITRVLSSKGILPIASLILLVIFFVAFSLLFVHPAEQLYFDENIYQGIALNILHSGSSTWCQYGSGSALSCPVSALYHDPAGISLLLAAAFAVFGASTGVAYSMELLFGAVSIFLMFLLASSLLPSRKGVIASTAVFALMPELFIWSRAQAVPNLYFMAFTILSFASFAMFMKHKTPWMLSMLLASITISSYMRIEGILLVPLFAVAYILYEGKGVIGRIYSTIKAFDSNTYYMVATLAFLLLMLPQAYYLSYEFANPQYGQGSSGLFSLSSFESNVLGMGVSGQSCIMAGIAMGPNVCFFLGSYTSAGTYPTIFLGTDTALAALGLLLLLAGYMKKSTRREVLVLCALWIMVYYLFYGFFYAGSALYGVDVRFMLELLPPISILGGISLSWIGSAPGAAYTSALRSRASRKSAEILNLCVMAAAAAILLAYPFWASIPVITIPPSSMPQQAVILNSVNFFYSNYSKVPASCLVFTYTPDIWYEVNRSAAQISYLGSSDAGFLNFTKNYRCFVYDVGYWCNVPPDEHACSSSISRYHTKDLASENLTSGFNDQSYGFYQLINYSS